MRTRWLLGPSLAALMWSCSEDATAPAPAAPIPMDRVAAHLARICSCTGEGDDIPQVELFGDDFMSEADRVPLGSRFVINNNIQFGIAGEFNVLGNSSGRHLDQFRLTTDLIFRY